MKFSRCLLARWFIGPDRAHLIPPRPLSSAAEAFVPHLGNLDDVVLSRDIHVWTKWFEWQHIIINGQGAVHNQHNNQTTSSSASVVCSSFKLQLLRFTHRPYLGQAAHLTYVIRRWSLKYSLIAQLARYQSGCVIHGVTGCKYIKYGLCMVVQKSGTYMHVT